jgi:GT2 family glycosyltransferase
MLWRRDVLTVLKGFDPRFFLYFEDFDISLRAGKVTRVAAVAVVRIAHFGGGAARKGWKHVRMFARSARLFFGLHGWKWI